MRTQSRVGVSVFCLLVFSVFLLLGCSGPTSTANVVKDRGPQRSCSIPGFDCFPSASASDTVAFNLRNNLETDITNTVVALNTSDCTLANPSVSIGYFPIGGENLVQFRCTTVPSYVTGGVTVTYRTKIGTKDQTVVGKLSYYPGD